MKNRSFKIGDVVVVGGNRQSKLKYDAYVQKWDSLGTDEVLIKYTVNHSDMGICIDDVLCNNEMQIMHADRGPVWICVDDVSIL